MTSLILLLAAGAAHADDVDDLCKDATLIHDIQGATHVSPEEGNVVTTCGVVTATGFRRFWIQSPIEDGDDATSEGLFVPQSASVSVGDLVRIQGTVVESIGGGAATGNLSVTQLEGITILDQSTAAVPAPVVIGESGRVPPATTVISEDELGDGINLQPGPDSDAATNVFDPANDGIDFYEAVEGMLVTVEEPVAVSAIRQFGSFSAEVFVLANDGVDAEPADAIHSRGGILLQPERDNRGDQNPERVQIQFDGGPYPEIKLGDRLSSVTGPVSYSFGNFEIVARTPVTVTDGGNEPETTARTRFGRLRVASYNVLNLSADDSDVEQMALVGQHIAQNLRAPEIVALQEIQDNNGTEPGELSADLTLQALIDAIVAAGGPRYAAFDVAPRVEVGPDTRDVDPDNFGGADFGNIRNAFLYDPKRVRLVKYKGLNRKVLAKRGVTYPNAFDFSRDPLEAEFRYLGRKVKVINNHFSSRFGSTPVFGGVQPFVQAAEEAREQQSQVMNDLVARELRKNDDAMVVVLGDLNTFEWTNDLAEILPAGDVLENLVDRNRDDAKYSFVFEGNSQALDHIYATPSLAKFATLDFVHVNNDFPRLFTTTVGSDHEPLVASFAVWRSFFESRRNRWWWRSDN